MKFFTLAAALAALVPAVLGDLTVTTPSGVTQCEPSQLTWSGGTGPYYVSILPAGQTTANPYETFPQQNGTSYTWNVNLEQGTSITIEVKDSTGAVQYSSIITIQGGSSTSCLNSTQPSGTASSGASPTGTGTGSGTPTAGSGSGSSTATGTSSGSSPTSTSTKSNGADRLSVSSAFGVAGIMGLVGATLF